MTRLRLAPALSLALLAVSMPALAADDDHSKVNGTIRIEAGEHTGDLDTVNGGIEIGPGAQVEDAETVNGSIEVAENASTRGLSTVNGDVRVGPGAAIDGDIETVNADLTVGAGSHVRGAIHYEEIKPSWFAFDRRDPRVVIGPNARVDGPLVFERKVQLFVHESAKTGPVTGATAVSYQGARAPQGD